MKWLEKFENCMEELEMREKKIGRRPKYVEKFELYQFKSIIFALID